MKFPLFRKNPRTVGQAPGTIEYVGEKRDEKILLNLIHYDENNFDFEEIPESHVEQISKKSGKKWLDIVGIHDPKILSKIGSGI